MIFSHLWSKKQKIKVISGFIVNFANAKSGALILKSKSEGINVFLNRLNL